MWFIWLGFTVYADRFDTDDVPHRLLVLAGMAVTAALAVHVDDAFSGGSIPFALCSILARAILLAMNVRAMRAVPVAGDYIAFYVRGWSVGLLLWAVSLAVPEPGRYVLWGVAVLVEVVTPLVAERRVGTLPLHVSHIGERFGLFTIIVLGESVVSVTAGIAEVDFDLANSVIAVGAFVVAAALAWVYFDRLGTELIGSTLYVYAHFIVYLGPGRGRTGNAAGDRGGRHIGVAGRRPSGPVRRHRAVPARALPGGGADARITARAPTDRRALRRGGGRGRDRLPRRGHRAGGDGAAARRGRRRRAGLRAGRRWR